jgi:RNA polymerase sigma-70 factor (family 1)
MIEEERYEQSKLIALLSEDSEYAFQLLYDRYRNKIYKLSLRFLKSSIIAQEVVQDVFLKLWFSRKSIDADKPLEAWLFTIAKNALINRFKKLANEWNALNKYKRSQNFSNDGADSKILTSELEELLQQAISQLPEKQKLIYQFARIQGFSYHEIADKFKISPLTVKTHLARASESIRLFLTEHGIKCVSLLAFLPIHALC